MSRSIKQMAVWLAVWMTAGCAMCTGTAVMAEEKQLAESVQETAEPETAAEKPTGFYVMEETSLRKEASAEAEELLALPMNSLVQILEPGVPEAEDSFAKVSFEEQEGFIPASLLGEYPVRYTTENLTLRKEADKESEKLAIVALNKKVPVLELGDPEEEGGYSRIIYKGMEGYVLTRYLTEDAEEALQAQKEADAYEAAKAAAARRSSESRRNRASSDEDEDEDDDEYDDYDEDDEDEVYEVSREKFDDCDGSGHGYYEITYSDGSTEIVDY